MGSRIVPGDGSPSRPAWVIGRDPGSTETAQGRPFVGRAGQILDRALGSAGLRREDVYIDNVVPEQPPANEWGRHDPAAIAAGVSRLHSFIAEHQPKLIVALGNEAFRACMAVHPDTNGELPQIMEARGYLWQSPLGPRVLSTVHPAFVDREWVPWRILLDLDFKKAAKELRLGCPPFPMRDVKVCAAEHEAETVLTYVNTAAELAVDLEGDHDGIDCFGLAASHSEAWVVPNVTPWQRDLVKAVAESKTPKILANGQYDRFVCGLFGIELRNQSFDVQLGWHALQPELAGQKMKVGARKRSRHTEKSLRFLASVLTREPFWKSYDFADEMEKYVLCGKDCAVTFEVAERLRELLG